MRQARFPGDGLLIVLAGGLLALAGDAEEPAGPLPPRVLRKIVDEVRAEHDVPALGAAVVRSDGVPTVAVVGVRKRGSKVAAQDDDKFHLGSDTKPWTAFLIAWLRERGLIDWDTPLAKVFPEYAKTMSDDWKEVTVGHLLTHRAGLPANLPGGWWKVPRDRTPREQRLLVLKQTVAQPLESKPGEKFEYSNLGYVLVGAVAERVGKASWEELLKKAVHDPLKLRQVGYGTPGTPERIEQPWPHDAKGEPQSPGLQSDNPPVMGPAGRLHASLGDWSRFLAEELRGARGEKGLLKPATYRKLFTSPPGEFYTYGAWAGSEQAGRMPKLVLSHDGTNTLNFVSATLVPELDLAVLTATNQGGKAGEAVCHDLALRLLKRMSK